MLPEIYLIKKYITEKIISEIKLAKNFDSETRSILNPEIKAKTLFQPKRNNSELIAKFRNIHVLPFIFNFI